MQGLSVSQSLYFPLSLSISLAGGKKFKHRQHWMSLSWSLIISRFLYSILLVHLSELFYVSVSLSFSDWFFVSLSLFESLQPYFEPISIYNLLLLISFSAFLPIWMVHVDWNIGNHLKPYLWSGERPANNKYQLPFWSEGGKNLFEIMLC